MRRVTFEYLNDMVAHYMEVSNGCGVEGRRWGEGVAPTNTGSVRSPSRSSSLALLSPPRSPLAHRPPPQRPGQAEQEANGRFTRVPDCSFIISWKKGGAGRRDVELEPALDVDNGSQRAPELFLTLSAESNGRSEEVAVIQAVKNR